VSTWLAERRAQAEFASTSVLFADLYWRWHDRGDAESAERLIQRLIEFRAAGGAQSVLIVDETATTLFSEVAGPGIDAAELRAAARRAMRTGTVQVTPLYGYDVAAPRMDIVAPLVRTGKPARAAIVLRIDPNFFLFPTLEAWPVPSTAGATVLIQRMGDQIVNLRDPARPQPLSTPDLLTAQVIRGELPFVQTVEGSGFRGVPVLGVVRPVPDTDWYLLARIDRSEVIAGMAASAVWIVFGGVLALIGGVIGINHLRQRERLNLAMVERSAQAEKMRALKLIEAVTESSTDRIFVRDLDGRYIFANRSTCNALGRPREDILGKGHDELVSAEEAAMLKANDARALAARAVLTFEERVSTARGRTNHLVTKGPVQDEHGNVIGLFGVARDITEERRREAELRASEERLRLFVEYAPAAIAMFDLQMNYIAASRRWLVDFKLGECDLVGRNHYDVFPDTPANWRAVHLRCLAGAIEHSDGDPMRNPDGSTDWVRWEMRPWHDEHGAIGGALLMSEMITGRVRAEAALRESERRLDLALSAAGMGVWEWNLVDGRVYWSREAVAIFSADPASASARDHDLEEFTSRVDPEDRERVLQGARAAVENQTVFEAEFRFRRYDGEVRWLSNLARTEYDPHGKPLRLIGTVHDITERKAMQAQNEQATALVSATLQSTDNGVLVADEKGRIVMWNRHMLDFLPNVNEQILRSGDRKALLAAALDAFADPEAVLRASRAIEAQPDFSDLSTVQLKDGRFIERFTQPMLIDGRVAGRVWSYRDVTARQRAIDDAETRSRELEIQVSRRTHDLERAIEERTASEKLVRLIADNIPGRVSYWNRAMRCVARVRWPRSRTAYPGAGGARRHADPRDDRECLWRGSRGLSCRRDERARREARRRSNDVRGVAALAAARCRGKSGDRPRRAATLRRRAWRGTRRAAALGAGRPLGRHPRFRPAARPALLRRT
jgi:PAS domain S-box-containing protein